MRRRRSNITKLGFTFVILLLSLFSISYSYAAWYDTITIDGTVTTGEWYSSISDFVWNDINQNGIQDPGEPGIPGVIINLYKFASPGVLIATTTTDAIGFYIFDGLLPGDYCLEFILPAGYAFSVPDAGGDAADSDPDPNTGLTAIFTLGQNEDVIIWDAGLYYVGEGCSYGYWKNHLDDWVGYTPDQTLGSVFVFPHPPLGSLGAYTFLEALEYSGPGSALIGKAKILMVQAVAALLNAAHPDVAYIFSETSVIDQTNAALASLDEDTIINLKDTFDYHNNFGGCLCD